MARRSQKDSEDHYSKEETQQRFEAALRGARIAGHTPQSETKIAAGKRSPPTKRKKRQPKR